MKAVLLSIQSKYCELIASGKKTVEVRKTRPKIDTPFKCYIYCSHGETLYRSVDDNNIHLTKKGRAEALKHHTLFNGKVIGEFVCDNTFMDIVGYKNDIPGYWRLINESCISNEQLMLYGKWKTLYGWHISDLVIYDTPKELNEFHFPPERYCEKGLCGGCPYDAVPNAYGEYDYDCSWERPIIRPPQSWCYVEELEG